jgi:hypothetical protein
VAKAQATYDRAKADFDRVDALKDDVAISKQDSRLGFPQHAGPRQRASALADVCRSGRHASQPTCGAVGALSAGGAAGGQAALWPIPECTQWRGPES